MFWMFQSNTLWSCRAFLHPFLLVSSCFYYLFFPVVRLILLIYLFSWLSNSQSVLQQYTISMFILFCLAFLKYFIVSHWMFLHCAMNFVSVVSALCGKFSASTVFICFCREKFHISVLIYIKWNCYSFGYPLSYQWLIQELNLGDGGRQLSLMNIDRQII